MLFSGIIFILQMKLLENMTFMYFIDKCTPKCLIPFYIPFYEEFINANISIRKIPWEQVTNDAAWQVMALVSLSKTLNHNCFILRMDRNIKEPHNDTYRTSVGIYPDVSGSIFR